MSAMDVLIFPSKFEGLPLTLIEAQAAGLPSLISDTITPDVVVTEGITERLSIEEDPMIWARRAVELAGKSAAGGGAGRTCQRESIAAAGYDIEQLTEWYEEFLQKLLRR
jgi:glycosyltransferase involved in cell wall biosynthesis